MILKKQVDFDNMWKWNRCKGLIKQNPKVIRIFSKDKYKQFNIQNHLDFINDYKRYCDCEIKSYSAKYIEDIEKEDFRSLICNEGLL